MRSSTRSFAAAVLGLAALSTSALAGEAVRLLVELDPSDTTEIRAGERLDVQVVGEDAEGNRVGFGRRTLEVSSTLGRVELREAPYAYVFVAPAAVDRPSPVRLRAWLKEAPEVKGERSVSVIPAAPFVRLVLKGAESTPPGAAVTVEVWGERADGDVVRVADEPVTAGTDGPGELRLVRPGVLRYEPPGEDSEAARHGATARIAAYLERYPEVRGEHRVRITRAGEPGPPKPEPPKPGPPKPEPPKPFRDPPRGDRPTAPMPEPPARGDRPAGGDDAEDDKGGVVWKGGHVRLATWRTRDPGTLEEWSKEREIPAPGAELTARKPWQKLRIVVLRDDVARIEVEEWVGERKGAKVSREEPGKQGRLRLTRNKESQDVVHVEASPPDDGKPLHVRVVLTLKSGRTVTEDFALVREAPERK